MTQRFRRNLPFLASFAVLGTALLFVSHKSHGGGAVSASPSPDAVREAGFTASLEGLLPLSGPGLALPHGAMLSAPGRADLVLESYRDEGFREGTLAFFGVLAGSGELAALILDNAARFEVPPSLAFALCWEESRYNPRALNRANRDRTTDRGLFQLNNASFPKLTEEDFFNPAINAYYGLSHLRWCLDTGGSEVTGLAMYNAGTNRVRSGGAPKTTLDYVGRILRSREKIEGLFQAEHRRLAALRDAETTEELEQRGFSMALLSPLGRR